MKRYLTFAALAVCVTILSPVAPLRAQAVQPSSDRPVADLSFTYSTLRANVPVGDCGCFWMNGGSAELAVPVWKSFSAVLEVSGERAGNLPGNPGVGLSLASAMGGVRFTHRIRHQWSPFAQGLFGEVHAFDSYFPGATPTGAASSFAMATGLGLDIPLHKHLWLRPVQAEYQYMQLPNNAVNPSNQQHDIRLSAGIVLRLTH